VSPHTQIQPKEIASRKISCILVHDHVLLRQGVRRLLQDEPDFLVVAEASNAAEAFQRIFECRPDVVIADERTLGLSAEDAESLILQESPHTRVLFLSAHAERGSVIRSVASGRMGCAVRETSADELVRMVRASHYHDAASTREASSEEDEWEAADATLPRRRVLTEREREVLKLLAEGQTVRSAANILGLSSKTVDAHKFNLMRKLGVHNKAELVMWAIGKRVVKLPAQF
jgi:DNA-binding NarL/FixJ family response regulator